MTYKPRLLFYLLSLTAFTSFGQVPIVTRVDSYVNGNNQRITLQGSNFGNNPADLSIWFGAVQATTIQTATEQTIEVLAPPGATYESIMVTNTSTNKSAWTKGEFLLSYGGSQPIALTDFDAQSDLNSESGLFDVCLCDLDGDGKSDISTANSGGNSPPTNSVAFFLNTSTAGGSFSFAQRPSVLPGIRSLHIRCGDLDGDGKKDLVITEADPGNRIFILRNTGTAGTISFAAPQNIPLIGKAPKRIEISDLDGDGKPELIITDQRSGNNDVIILPNTSSGATISFADQVILNVPGAGSTSSDGLAVQDLNDDNKPEIVVNQFLTANSNVFIYTNESTEGNFRFNKVTTLTLSGTPVNVRVGDVDGDSKPDVVATQLLAATISVFLNQSDSQVKFGAPTSFDTDTQPWGLDFGDLDGDGKLDIVVSSLTGTGDVNPKSLTLLNNTSTAGNVSFAPKVVQATTFANRHVVVGDVDGDSKPDITYTSVDDIGRGILASKVSFFKNKSCIAPRVSPEGPLVVCASFPIALEGTVSAGATYQWKESGIVIPTQTNASFTPSSSGSYTLDITSDGCTRTSAAVQVTVTAGTAAAPSFTNNSPICEGGTISITATAVGGTDYNWTGPAGFTGTGATISRGPYTPEFGGRYEVEVMAGSCIAAKGSALVETISLPDFSIGYTGSDVICTGDTKTLVAAPVDPNFTYQWTNAGNDIGGATTDSFGVTATGSYAFKAKSTLYPGCPEVVSETVDITVAAIPSVNFDAPAETCKDAVTTFTNQSTLDANGGPQYSWAFGDGGTSTDISPTHTYVAAATSLTVKLTASYRDNACATSQTKQIKVSLPPTATITAPDNTFQFCDGDKITLSVSSGFASYLWSNSANTPTIDVTASGTYTVQLTTSIGCKLSASQVVTTFPKPDVSINAEKNPINIGEQTKLSATSGLSSYDWTPPETLDDATSATPIAKPKATTTYTLTVADNNGCIGTATFELDVNVDNPTSLLQPFNFFSPNGDPVNDAWKVINIENFPQCAVTIFDEKGLKVYEAKPYLNNWDGTSNGKKLPDGVYYYMIRCDGDSGSRTGSITILR
jgi:gliding motility-associated-like protein